MIDKTVLESRIIRCDKAYSVLSESTQSESTQYLEGEGVNDLAQLMRLGIEGGGTVEETTAAEHHPARLQLFISTVHKTPEQAQTQ